MSSVTLNPQERFRQHMNELERIRLQGEKQRLPAHSSHGRGRGGGGRGGGGARPQAPRDGDPKDGDGVGVDDRVRGIITEIDYAKRRGMVKSEMTGEVLFYLEQCEFGLRKMKKNEQVRFRLDTFRPRPLAIEVAPLDTSAPISDEDVTFFINECRDVKVPVALMRRILIASEDWPKFIASVPKARLREVICSAIRLVTYHENVANPINIRIIRAFLDMLASTASTSGNTNNLGSAADPPAVFPHYVAKLIGTAHPSGAPDSAGADDDNAVSPTFTQPSGGDIDALLAVPVASPSSRRPAAAAASATGGSVVSLVDQRINVFLEISELVLLFRSYTLLPEDVIAQVSNPLADTALSLHAQAAFIGLSEKSKRKLKQVIQRASPQEGAFLRSAIIPCAADLSIPTWNKASPLCPANLPNAVTATFATATEYIVAHCNLLRADNFSRTVNVMGVTCFDIPAFRDRSADASEAEENAKYNNLFCGVQYIGHTLARDHEYNSADSYVFSLKEPVTRPFARKEKARKRGPNGEAAGGAEEGVEEEPSIAPIRWGSCLEVGTLVCFTTGEDRTTICEDELFWGTVSTTDDGMRAHHLVAVTPVMGDFNRLVRHLERNAAGGISDTRSLLLETSVFFTGYRSVMEGLLTYIGTGAAKLPFDDILLAANAANVAATTASSDNDETLTTFSSSSASPAVDATKAALNAVKDPSHWHIPPFTRPAFDLLTHNACQQCTFDVGQQESVQTLCDRRIQIVQGPPGTGKSFIGCRIVENYVRYKQLLASGDILNFVDVESLPDSELSTITPSLAAQRPNHVGPIVVITYKNHALDEFLLDLRRSKLWDAERTRFDQQSVMYPRGCRIVRVGGRSQEEDLQDYNLTTLISSSPAAKYKVAPYRERVAILMKRIERLVKEIAHLEKGNVPSAYFNSWLTEDQRKTLQYSMRAAWLRGDNYAGGDGLPIADPNLYLKSLTTAFRAKLDSAAPIAPGSGPTLPRDMDDEQRGTVFGDMEKEMRREDKSSNGQTDPTGSPSSSGSVSISGRISSTCVGKESLEYARRGVTLPASVPNPNGLLSLWSLSPKARHEYYAYLIQRCIATKASEYLSLVQQIKTVVTLRNHAQDEGKMELLQQADVIGLTTTGCAMNQNLLRALRPRVLVVEEAAEVLEAQLVACMSDSLAQVVLIGDHYQLKPSVETFALELKNNLNTSLFERLTSIIRPILLVEQRRMRPGISALIRQFYDKQGLTDHASVIERAFIDGNGLKHLKGAVGLRQDAFLWTHEHVEETAPTGLSKINTLEIKLTAMLVEHLIREGVSPTSITVITPYLGQRRAIAAVLKTSESSAVRHVRVSTVDMFQGDENDIIIVSLVRAQKLTAFMKMRNRMIVACSRARHAMVLIGNEGLLRQSDHWSQVLDLLADKHCIGEALPISTRGAPQLLLQDGHKVDVACPPLK